jgi:hypothetical protein
MPHQVFTPSIGILTFLLLTILSTSNATARDIKVNTDQYRAEAAKTVNARKTEIANTTSQTRATSQATTVNANKTAQQSVNKATQNLQPGQQAIRIGNAEEVRTGAPSDQTVADDKTGTPHITVGNIVQSQSDLGGSQIIEIGRGTSSDKIKAGNIVQSGSGNKRIVIGTPEPRSTPDQDSPIP